MLLPFSSRYGTDKTYLHFILFSNYFSNVFCGEIQISESVTQFRYPKFSDNGFIEWVLEGNSGNYKQSDISIEV